MHLHSTISPEREPESLLDTPIWGDLVVVLGVGLGYQLDQVDFSTAQRVVLVDVYDPLLERASARLRSRKTGVTCVNARDIHRLVAALDSAPQASLQLLKHPASHRAFPEVYAALASALIQVRTKLTPPQTAGPKARRVLLMQGRYFLEREIAEALGERVHLLHYQKVPEGSPRQSAFQALIEKERPDVILSIGFKGFDREGALFEMAEHYGIPVAVWFLDDPRLGTLAFSEHIGTHVHAFVWDSAYAPWLKKQGFASVAVLPLGASETVFQTHRRAKPDLPLSFVGSALGRDFLNKIRARFLWDPAHQESVNERAHQLLSGEIDALSITHTELPHRDELNRIWFANLAIHTASHLKRVAVCRALVSQNLATFGDPETWQGILGSEGQCRPSLDYYTELAGVYQRSAINLNITSCQMPTTVNQRLFDVPLAGGFLLTDPQADALCLFKEDKEVVIYRSIEEAQDKVRFFTQNPSARLPIIQAARRRVLAEHLVSHRVRTLLQGVFG
jgi:spore maturation protein CgeB